MINKTPLLILRELKHASKLEKYNSIKPEYIPLTKYSDTNSNGLTTAIVDFIDLSGGHATRINTTGIYDTVNKRFRQSNTKKGTADIHAIIKGKHVSIEVKIGKDQQSDIQLKRQREIEKAGGIYYVARSFNDFYEWYNKQFNL